MIGEKLLVVQNGWAGQTVTKLRSMQKTGRVCDMFLQAESGDVVPCHSCIMIANIPSLADQLPGTGQERASHKPTIRDLLKGLSVKTIEQVVLFCYGGCLEVVPTDLTEVLVAAKQLRFDELVESCELVIRQKGKLSPTVTDNLCRMQSFVVLASDINNPSREEAIREHVDHSAEAIEALEEIVKVEVSEENVENSSHNKAGSQASQKVASNQRKSDDEESCQSDDSSNQTIEENSEKDVDLDLNASQEVSDYDSEATDIMEDVEDDTEEVEEKKSPRKQTRKKYNKGTKKEFKCGVCGKVLVSNAALRDHMNGHNGLKPYKCLQCDKCFAARGSLKEHLVVHKGESFPCDKCGKSFFSRKQMMRHCKNHPPDFVPKSHNQQECRCDICGKSFSYLKSLRDHINIHKGIKPYQCDLCDKAYSVEASLNDHKIKHRGKQFPCKYCAKFLPSQKKLRKHIRCHGEKVLEQANETPVHKCEECGKLFHSPFNLKQHIKQIHKREVKQHICPVCGKILKTRHGMDLHVLGCTDRGQFACEFCDKHYVTRSGLDKHITWAHRREMLASDKYSHQVKLCKHCGQSFLCRALLMEHERTHSKERNYRCDLCNKTFKSHNNVLNHKRNVHVQAENLHRCEVCNTTIKSSGAFKRHQKMHLSQPTHQCDSCGKGYNRRDMLNQHLLTCKQQPAPKQHRDQNNMGQKPQCVPQTMSTLAYTDNYPPQNTHQDKPMYLQQQQPHHPEGQMFATDVGHLPPLSHAHSLQHVQQHYGLTQVEQNFCRL